MPPLRSRDLCNSESDWLIPVENTYMYAMIPGDVIRCTISSCASGHVENVKMVMFLPAWLA